MALCGQSMHIMSVVIAVTNIPSSTLPYSHAYSVATVTFLRNFYVL